MKFELGELIRQENTRYRVIKYKIKLNSKQGGNNPLICVHLSPLKVLVSVVSDEIHRY